ncbi:MAG: sensor histidine kinase [Saprospiraceae bacterium]
MTNSVIRRVFILGLLSIVSLVSVQTYWVYRSWDLQERVFDRKATQALLDAAKDLSKHYQFQLPAENLIKRLSSNYYVVNINNMFDTITLEFYLRKAFENLGLKEDFQYGVFDCSSNQMVAGRVIKYRRVTDRQAREILDEPLPAHEDSDFIYYFGVRFPDKTATIINSIWFVIVFTALMLLTVVFFIYSMFVILRQKQLSELQTDFINNMTHEFKTPIATINVSTDVLQQNELIRADPRLNRYAGIIKDQVMRLNTQVEKVLQVAKSERESMPLQSERIDLEELLMDIGPSIEIKVQEKPGGRLTYDIQTQKTMVMADRLHLTNILHNLADNAVKYSKDAPQITLSLAPHSPNHVRLSVSDKGIGIPREHQKRVFDKFFRVPKGNVHDVKGFGLGLYYVKRVCKEHRWQVELESAPGKGSTISIIMPLAN